MQSPISLLFQCPPFPYLIACGRAHFDAGDAHHSRQNTAVFDLITVYKGTLYLNENGRDYEVGPGCSFILRPDRYHYSTRNCSEDTYFYWIHFLAADRWEESSGSLDKNGTGDADIGEASRHNRDVFKMYNYRIQIAKLYKHPYPSTIYRKFEQILSLESSSSSAARWEQQIVFEELLKEMHREHSLSGDQRAVELAERVATYLRQNYRLPFENGMLREMFHFHPHHLIRCMRKVYGCTPLEYLLRYRLEQGKLLLLRTGWPVTRIAEEVGFTQLSYFTRCFREYEGISPNQFRKKFIKA
ncbi:MAG TPA: AraC family transcriptional regulator [Paenibacillus sp.]|uniref:AraC family transcriptional regulator n=1 Tax=Paenibacillus sp. TaxID=58172 RepID=UPI002C448B5A|nr:AraC family transcriptional regulator [Paenibacillus sp.]HUC94062.1 AraC family transcriptional regulator [Paenibacillus sp.]